MRDYRLTEAKVDNDRPPRYYCARYTTNGYHYVQKCNPDPDRNSGVTRQMMVDLLDFLKKGHWIDKQTRLVSITLQVRSNNGGMRSVTRFMFELTQMAAVLPSFDMEAMVDDPESTRKMKVYMLMALGLTAYFIMLEVIEFATSSLSEYLSNVWNVLDWANFLLFFQVFANLIEVDVLANRDRERLIWPTDGTPGDCGSVICNQFGFMDLWEIMHTARTAKLFMSICVCIQLLKIIKFTNVIIPKMSLMTAVLSKGCYDLLFFGIIFAISMFAFCMLFYIQLGSFMDDFYSQPASMIALAKALFGDFDFEEIMDNSRGYLNARALPHLPLRRRLHPALDVPRHPRRGAGGGARGRDDATRGGEGGPALRRAGRREGLDLELRQEDPREAEEAQGGRGGGGRRGGGRGRGRGRAPRHGAADRAAQDAGQARHVAQATHERPRGAPPQGAEQDGDEASRVAQPRRVRCLVEREADQCGEEQARDPRWRRRPKSEVRPVLGVARAAEEGQRACEQEQQRRAAEVSRKCKSSCEAQTVCDQHDRFGGIASGLSTEQLILLIL